MPTAEFDGLFEWLYDCNLLQRLLGLRHCSNC